ncbi:hypothetical protein N9X81_00055 [Schleiferiaceae bacterium]|nr:hypothetical protein [Schleiferiaceae bacterium]
MSQFIAVSKEPRWMKPLGAIMVLPGFIALIPFKADYLQMWDIPLYVIAGLGVLLLLRATQKIGWRLNLEDNVLYYGKFNLYGSWKKRRSQEFALSSEKMTKVEFEGSDFVITYHPSKKLTFSTKGLSSIAHTRLERLKSALEAQIKTQDRA